MFRFTYSEHDFHACRPPAPDGCGLITSQCVRSGRYYFRRYQDRQGERPFCQTVKLNAPVGFNSSFNCAGPAGRRGRAGLKNPLYIIVCVTRVASRRGGKFSTRVRAFIISRRHRRRRRRRGLVYGAYKNIIVRSLDLASLFRIARKGTYLSFPLTTAVINIHTYIHTRAYPILRGRRSEVTCAKRIYEAPFQSSILAVSSGRHENFHEPS